jgi:hypothetical protein
MSLFPTLCHNTFAQDSSCLFLQKFLKVNKRFTLHKLTKTSISFNLTTRSECFFVGVNLSLLSRVMSSRLSRGTYNGGLLSTEAGTIARVIADATITVAGFFGRNMLLNVTLLPSLVICVLSIVATCFTYNSLY